MRTLLAAAFCFLLGGSLFAQTSDQKLKQLLSYSTKTQIDSAQFFAALKIFEECEANHELDISMRGESDDNTFHDSVLKIFGIICLKSDGTYAVDQYIKFVRRNLGSANEEISYVFERIFEKYPGYTLKKISVDKALLDSVEWGFVNNHYHDLASKNCKAVLFKAVPSIKALYPLYKKQIDYILASAKSDIKE